MRVPEAIRRGIIGRRRFSLEAMFAAGAVAGFDFTDLDPAKTWGPDATPLMQRDAIGSPTTVANPAVYSVLDKSGGFALGPELITSNADFSSATGWVLDAGWAITGGKAVHTPGSAGDLIRFPNPVNALGDMIRAKVNISGRTAGGLSVKSPFNHAGIPHMANGDAVAIGIAAQANAFRYAAQSAFDGSLDDVSMRKIAGNGALQTSSSAQPSYAQSGALKYLTLDGVDDCLATTLLPSATMMMAACVRVGSASKIVLGSIGAADTRSYIGLDAAGRAAAGVGADGTTVLQVGPDIRGADAVIGLRYDAGQVELAVGIGGAYAAQTFALNGAPNTTIPYALGCLNNNAGSFTNNMDGRLYGAAAMAQYGRPTDLRGLMRLIGANANLSF